MNLTLVEKQGYYNYIAHNVHIPPIVSLYNENYRKTSLFENINKKLSYSQDLNLKFVIVR